MRNILPKLLVWATGKPRYIPEITWSNKSWTHNVFRSYEQIFGRRYGVRAEMTSAFDGEKVTYQCHTIESVFALTETYIRNLSKMKFKFPFKIWIPMLMTTSGLPMPASPFLFAVAFDATSKAAAAFNVGATSLSWSHVCTGANLNLLVFVTLGQVQTVPSSVTYNSVTVTPITSNTDTNAYTSSYQSLLNPDQGSNTVLVSFGSSAWAEAMAVSYSGTDTTQHQDSFNSAHNASNQAITVSTTVVADNCWLVGYAHSRCNSNVGPLLDNKTSRNTQNVQSALFTNVCDSNAVVTAGSQSIIFTDTGNDPGSKVGIVLSLAPTLPPNATNFFMFMSRQDFA